MGAVACGSAYAAESTGEQIYRAGVLPSGALLRGTRADGLTLEGAAAACVTCHRRSGLGSYEGSVTVPPILGRYLFRTRQINVQDLSLPHVLGYRANRDAYSEDTLAQVIRTGAAPGGRYLNPVMPRYALDAAAMKALIGYLKQLGTDAVPGVSDTELHFATIVTPDADPVATEAMLTVMQRFFAVQNEVIAAEVRPMKSDREIMYRVTRRWQLHVWRLTGAPEDWGRQLRQHLTAEPVFAAIAGIGGNTWQPVHEFCESQSLPCLLPNTDLPVVKERDFYPVYWSRGVLLEADLLSHALNAGDLPDKSRGRVIQMFRADDIGVRASQQLRDDLHEHRREVVDQPFDGELSGSGRRLFSGLRSGDQLVLWLRNADLAKLPDELPAGVEVYASGVMAGLERATPPHSWRSRLHLAYPYDLPQSRSVRMNFPLGWLRLQRIPISDERIQTNTYIACQILAEALGHMLDSFVREFLVERLEMMLSSRLVSGYYPRLGLAPGQRFASKGGYTVHFAAPDGNSIVPDGEWIVP